MIDNDWQADDIQTDFVSDITINYVDKVNGKFSKKDINC